jgi:putative phosphoesterase
MKKIGLLSDTHGYLDPAVYTHFEQCDEIWHAGDFGTMEVADKLSDFKILRGVYGNIDGGILRKEFPQNQVFECEGVKVVMTHIGGYPGKYTSRLRDLLGKHKPDLYICGHSHILKVIYDKKYQVLHMNPGACGMQGFHQVRTVVRFDLISGRITNAEIIELGPRSKGIPSADLCQGS